MNSAARDSDRPTSAVEPDPDVVDALTRILVRACRKLGEAGRPADAGRLAADAWLAVRSDHPRQAQHLDGAMHHIARLEERAQACDLRGVRRWDSIVESFGKLAVGADLVLVDDRDPAAARDQLEAEHRGEFHWDYLDEGPQVWRVRIGRIAPAPSNVQKG